ncbi:MAG: right-handed parallel beta-helix repeat-containing protein, partial [Chloroflexota bacterium]
MDNNKRTTSTSSKSIWRLLRTDLLIFLAIITIAVITTTLLYGSPQQGRTQLVATLRQLGQTDDGSTFIRYVSNNTNNTGSHNPCTRWLEDYDNDTDDSGDTPPDDDDDTNDVYDYRKACATIQQAVNIANNGDIIRVDKGNYIQSVIIENKELTLVGGYYNGFGQLADPLFDWEVNPTYIQGSGGRGLTIRNSKVTMEGFRIHGGGTGNSGGGIAVDNGSNATLDKMLVFNNAAGSGGGGIYVGGSSTYLKITNSSIFNNNAAGNYGGGIFINNANIDAENVLIHNNFARLEGGGININSQLTQTLKMITVTNNIAGSNAGGIRAYNTNVPIENAYIGGNSAPFGGGFYQSFGTMTLKNVIFQQNNASSNGGGAYVDQSATKLELDTVEFISNTANVGGGFYIQNADFITMTSNIVRGNATNNNGGGGFINTGGSFKIDGSDFKLNTGRQGGGLYIQASNVVLNTNNYLNNVTTSGGAGMFINASSAITLSSETFEGNVASGNGGGLRIQNITDSISRPKFTALTFKNNSATASGGGFYASGSIMDMSADLTENHADVHGGGFTVDFNTTMTMPLSTLTGNTANNVGGGCYIANGSVAIIEGTSIEENIAGTYGGGCYVLSAEMDMIKNGAVNNNVATGNDGGGFYVNNSTVLFDSLQMFENKAQFNGGGIHAVDSNVDIAGAVDIQFNEAISSNGGGILLDTAVVSATSNFILRENKALNRGGGIYANNGSWTSHGGSLDISVNSAENSNGGGIYANNWAGSFVDLAMSENSSGSGGGAIYAGNSSLGFAGTTNFTENRTRAGNGGAIRLASATSPVSIPDVTFSKNGAIASGGGVYATATTLTLGPNANLSENTTSQSHGGGVFVGSGSTLTLDSATFSKNQAAQHGGGLYVTASDVTIQNSGVFNENTTLDGNGAGAYLTGNGTASFADTVFSKNTTGSISQNDGHAGGLFSANTSTTVANSTFSENDAGTAQGGAMRLSAGTVVLSENVIENNTTKGYGAGVYMTGVGNATIFSNTIQTNVLNPNSVVESLTLSSDVTAPDGSVIAQTGETLQATTVQDGDGAGLYINDSTVDMSHNLVFANVGSNEGAGMYLRQTDATLTNNVIAQNRVSQEGSPLGPFASGIHQEDGTVTMVHNTVADNLHASLNDDDELVVLSETTTIGIYVSNLGGSTGVLNMTNNIVSGHDVGLRLDGGNTANMHSTLWDNGSIDWTGGGTFASSFDNYRGAPNFEAAGEGNYAIQRQSAAFDVARPTSETGVTIARDGTARPQGFAPDLGAYEQRYTNGLVMLATGVGPAGTPFVYNGETIDFSIRLRNDSDIVIENINMNARLPLQLSLPADSPTVNIFTETVALLAQGEEVDITFSATVDGNPSTTSFVNMQVNVTAFSTTTIQSDNNTSIVTYLQSCAVDYNGTSYATVQEAVDAAADTISSLVRVSGYCGDSQTVNGSTQAVYIDKNLTLQGGWDSTFTTWDPTTHPTTIDAADTGRVIVVTGAGNSPVVEYLTLRNGDAFIQEGGFAGRDAGGILYIKDATPVVSNLSLAGGSSNDYGGGVYINVTDPFTISNTTIRSSQSNIWGGGLYVQAGQPTLHNLNMSGNRAQMGGAIYLDRTNALVTGDSDMDEFGQTSGDNCTIINNIATGTPTYVLTTDPDGNEETAWLEAGGGGGIAVDQSTATIRGCTLSTNQATRGGGIYVYQSQSTIVNNLIQSNSTFNSDQDPAPDTSDGGGLYLDRQVGVQPIVDSNFFGFNLAGRGSALFANLQTDTPLDLYHNTIAHNESDTTVMAYGQTNLNLHNSIVALNLGTAIQAEPAETTDTIFVGSFPIDYETYHAPTINMDYTLWFDNSDEDGAGTDFGASVNRTNDRTGDPVFRNDGYHIKRASAAYGFAGTASGMMDVDGTTRWDGIDRDINGRPQGVVLDMGADEYFPARGVRYVTTTGVGTAPCDDVTDPCGSIQLAVDSAEAGDIIKIAGGTYTELAERGPEGSPHTQIVYINKSITLQGGFYPDAVDNNVVESLYT